MATTEMISLDWQGAKGGCDLLHKRMTATALAPTRFPTRATVAIGAHENGKKPIDRRGGASFNCRFNQRRT